MSPINRNTLGLRVDKRLAGYAALAGAALAAPAAADAAIIYSGPLSIPIIANIDGLYVNFVTGANANATVAGWDFNPYLTGGFLTFFTSTGVANNNQVVGAAGVVSALAAGTLIGPASAYATAGAISTTGTVFRTTQSTAYVGIRFTNESTATINYGWALISTSATTGFPATLLGYAFDNTGLPILAGQTAIPEPSTAALFGVMAAGALGVRAWRKRKAA
jgi:hypothetical protein